MVTNVLRKKRNGKAIINLGSISAVSTGKCRLQLLRTISHACGDTPSKTQKRQQRHEIADWISRPRKAPRNGTVKQTLNEDMVSVAPLLLREFFTFVELGSFALYNERGEPQLTANSGVQNWTGLPFS